MATEKPKYYTKEYWRDWYWNRGGREKVQARRKIRDYERFTATDCHGLSRTKKIKSV